MKRLNLLKLRNFTGISQKKLAELLSVRPSFLSAIEKGRSRFPDDKLDRLKEIMNIDDLSDFMVDEESEAVLTVPPHSHPHTHSHPESDTIAEFLKHIHNQAHREDHDMAEKLNECRERADFLMKRNDRLSDRLDTLREEVDSLRSENFRLKELLIRNNIDF